jgi:hypothetical protein
MASGNGLMAILSRSARKWLVVGMFVAMAALSSSMVASARDRKPDYGRLEITTSPEAYPLLIDGELSGTTAGTPRLVDLPPGRHTVEVQFPAGARWIRDFDIVRGKRQCLVLNYKPHVITITKSPCPFPVNVSSPNVVNDGDLITFSSDVDYRGSNPLTYTWTVSPASARVVNGAGTNSITVDSTGLGRQSVTAALLVDDGSGEAVCRQSARAATNVIALPPPPVKPRRFDAFPSIAFDDDKARLDNLAIELQNDPTAIGYVIVYAGRTSRTGQADRLGARATDYLIQTRGIDPRRVVLVNGGYRETDYFELWIVPQGAQPPQPTPTVQPSEARPGGATPSRSRSRRR